METENTKDDIKVSVEKSSSQDQTVPVSSRCRPPMSKLFYVRRKHDTQSGKTKISNNEGASGPSQSEQVVDNCMATITNTEQEQPPEIEPVNIDFLKATPVLVPCNTASSDGPSPPISLVKHSNDNSLGVNAASAGPKQHRGMDESHWKDQFARLQAYLQSCDNSNQEVYTNMLRSSTPAERSKLAVELEKRAIQLVMEEGIEMERARALNMLGNNKPEK